MSIIWPRLRCQAGASNPLRLLTRSRFVVPVVTRIHRRPALRTLRTVKSERWRAACGREADSGAAGTRNRAREELGGGWSPGGPAVQRLLKAGGDGVLWCQSDQQAGRQPLAANSAGAQAFRGDSKGGVAPPRQTAMFNRASAGLGPVTVDIELAERRGMGRALGNDVKELRLVTRPCGPAVRFRRGGARTSSSVVRRGVRNRARTSPARRAARRVNPLSCRTARTRRPKGHFPR